MPLQNHSGEKPAPTTQTDTGASSTPAPLAADGGVPGDAARKLRQASASKKSVSRFSLIYLSIAAITLLVGAVWTYFLRDFVPITILAVGVLLLGMAVARWQRSWVIGLSVFAAMALVIGGAWYWYIGRGPYETSIAVRIADRDGKPVSRANIILLYGGETPIKQATDSNGIVTFTADSTYREARLVAEASGYQVHEEVVNLARSRDMAVNLRPLDEDVRNVIVRVVNKTDLRPINGAKVLLITGGNPFSDLTDDNGLAKFDVTFTSDTLDADLTVEAEKDGISNQNVSLRPDQLQEVRLDAVNQVVNVAPVQAFNRPDIRRSGGGSGPNAPEVLTNIAVFTDIAAGDEQEPNDENSSAQAIETIGADHPITAEINAAGDRDYYAFETVAGNTYVIELFNVDTRLGLSPVDYNCFGNWGNYKGLGVAVYDPGDNRVAWQCTQNAGGNAYATLRFTAEVNGRHVIEIFPHSDKVLGSYSLRIAPKHDEEGATWDHITFEPNNNAVNAFPIQPGYENALTSAIGKTEHTYMADQPDVDWYQFHAVAGRTYVVEIFDVESLLDLGTVEYSCFGDYGSYTGLGVAIYRPNLDTVASTCAPSGAGDVHTSVEVQAEVDGPYYIQIFPHVTTVSGIYNIRVLPKHNEAGANRDPVTLEPNNRWVNAADMDIERRNEISSAIEERTPGYSTNTADRDWYHFRAEAGSSYVVDILDVADTLLLGSREYNCYGNYGRYSGMGVAVYDASAEFIAAQCEPIGEEGIRTSVEFQALVNADYYIQVFPHFEQAYGEYKIRIRKK